jgi:hypothetical protein
MLSSARSPLFLIQIELHLLLFWFWSSRSYLHQVSSILLFCHDPPFTQLSHNEVALSYSHSYSKSKF